VQRGHHFAIVDEVDSILIDEARTPLIISGMVADSAKWYVTFARLVPALHRDTDYEIDESKRTVAVTEEGVGKVEERLGIDNLDVYEIPTKRDMIRDDEQDQIYKNEDAKWNAVTEDIAGRYERGQPVLVGTVSIEKSERLSGYLNRRGVPHHVLNAKQHERE